MHLGDVLRVRFGHLLDVDAAHVAEDEDRKLPAAVPGDGGEVLLRDAGALLDEDAARLLPVDLELEDRLGRRLGLIRGIRELDPARFHAAARQHLRFQDDGAADLGCDRLRLGGGVRQASPQERGAVAREESLGLVLVEPHRSARTGQLTLGFADGQGDGVLSVARVPLTRRAAVHRTRSDRIFASQPPRASCGHGRRALVPAPSQPAPASLGTTAPTSRDPGRVLPRSACGDSSAHKPGKAAWLVGS